MANTFPWTDWLVLLSLFCCLMPRLIILLLPSKGWDYKCGPPFCFSLQCVCVCACIHVCIHAYKHMNCVCEFQCRHGIGFHHPPCFWGRVPHFSRFPHVSRLAGPKLLVQSSSLLKSQHRSTGITVPATAFGSCLSSRDSNPFFWMGLDWFTLE